MSSLMFGHEVLKVFRPLLHQPEALTTAPPPLATNRGASSSAVAGA